MQCTYTRPQCDERPEGCVKCADKGFVCPGYDRSLDRFFQDESAAVRIKAEKAKAKALRARDERDKAARAKTAITRVQDAIGMPLLCPLIDQGIAFFMANYAMAVEQPPMQSEAYHKHLGTFGFHPLIATTMTALGLAGVANICMSIGMKRESMKWYLNALKMTNEALASPGEVRSDNTLLATMLLSVFEQTSNEHSLRGYSNHIAGSAQLLRMRGPGQFATPAGRRMYMQTIGLLTMKCMGEGNPLPQFVHDLNEEVVKWEDKSDPGNKFYHLHIAAIDFRATVLHGKLRSLPDIVSRALAIDADAKAIFEDTADDWSYTVERCDPGAPGVFGEEYHIYPHLACAQTRNWVRYNRVYVHDIIRNAIIAGLSASPPVFTGPKPIRLLEESTQILYQMQSEILASIPQYLHDTPKTPNSYIRNYTYTCAPTSTREGLRRLMPNSPPSPPKLLTSNFLPRPGPLNPQWALPATPSERLPLIRVSGGYSSLWPLYIAGAMPVASPESQEFVLQSLGRIGTEFGINQAKILAAALKRKIQADRVGDGLGGIGTVASSLVPIYMPRYGPHTEED